MHWLLRSIRSLALVFLAALSAGASENGTGSAFTSSQNLWAAADFDGDHSIDLARVKIRRTGHSVVVSGVDLSAFRTPSLPPVAGSIHGSGLVLSVRDVDADHDQDLILRDPFAETALAVWLNDGEGVFTQSIPSDFPGAGDDQTSMQKRASPFRPPAAAPSYKLCPTVARCTDPFGLAPGSPRRSIPQQEPLSAGWQAANQTRGPPLPSR